MMVFAHIHTGPVHGGRISSRDGTRVVQLIRSPQMKWTERRGPDKFNANGSVTAYGTPFPSLEVWQYSEGGRADLVYFWDALAAGTNIGHLLQPFYRDLPNMHVPGGGGGGGMF